MKKIIVITFLLVTSFSYSQKINKEIISKNKPILVGQLNKNGLTTVPYKSWFNLQYESYDIDKELINDIKSHINNYKVQIFMGTWCGDSKRQVPRFYKILENANYKMKNLEVVGVGNGLENYKKSPTGEEKGLNIKRVPTFIIYKNDKEIGRIIERPVHSLEKDLHAILVQASN
ncbi:thioredoxin family protein [Spongiivirga sp. MCCC 1A20706]|uniref:thioredoxin family protein n=1 Tax=Spongiivirga sp. MCCC 1A20706 TaxID=3160963 RepID=UPI003977A602